MNWTNKTPTEPGVYWFRPQKTRLWRLAKVDRSEEGSLIERVLAGFIDVRIENYIGDWAGPLKPPTTLG